MASWVPRLRPPAWQVALAVLLAQGVVDWGIKPIIARPRPFIADTIHVSWAISLRRIRFHRATRRRRLRAATVLAFALSPQARGHHLGAGVAGRVFTHLHRGALPARRGGRRAVRRADRPVGYGRTCMVYWGFVDGVPPRAEVAQLVEHTTENRGVGSSILPLGTIHC